MKSERVSMRPIRKCKEKLTDSNESNEEGDNTDVEDAILDDLLQRTNVSFNA